MARMRALVFTDLDAGGTASDLPLTPPEGLRVKRGTRIAVIFVIALCSGAVVAAIGCSSAPTDSRARRSPPTKVAVYGVPTDSAPRGTRLDGSCELGSSFVSNRPDAARCFATESDDRGVDLFDPCFHSKADTPGMVEVFVCPEDPWNDRARRTVVTVTGDTGTLGEASSSFRPWALLLANGQRCFRISGATGTTAGVRHNYQCYRPPFARNPRQPIGKDGGVVLGEPDQQRRVWTALFMKDSTKNRFMPVEVRRARE
jgi:hypothetical protein